MPRYGGGQEDFRAQEARLAAMQERLAAIEAKEIQAAKAADELGAAEQRATTQRSLLNRAKREGADITAREEATAGQEARAVNLDTAAIERNRLARERRAAAAKLEQIALARANTLPYFGRSDIIVHPTAATGVRTSVEGVERGIAASMAAARAEREAAAAAEQHIAALQAQIPALSAVSDAERAYVASLSAERRAYLESTAAGASAAEGRIAERSAMTAAALRQEAVAYGAVNQSMFKHGALSQEYILAAARGETTLRDLGQQALVTAGKFGAWTAAATGIFAVAGALKEIGSGAIQAQSGATGLQRFIPNLNRDEAIKGFTDTSRELNVPIQEVAQTQQVLARVFNNQRDSLTATSVALKAYKLDQVDAADSARYFTAIVQEGRLPVERLPLLFDQLDASQRRFGARVQETLPALARSFGAVRNAGGDLNQLIALISTAQTASGQTGNTVGTAFTRAASNFFRRPDNQKVLESFGLDPSKGFTQVVIDAVRKARNLSGEERTQLAQALAGPQYGGRIFVPLLNQAGRLEKAQRVTDPNAPGVRGSADEELKRLVSQADEQLHRLGLSLQRLGAELSQAGAFNILGLLLRSLNAVLGAAGDLVNVFNEIPEPLRSTISMVVELMLVMKALRRFGGESLANGPLAAFASPERQFATRARRSLRDVRDTTLNEAESTQRRAASLANGAQRAQIAAERAAAENARIAAQYTERSAEADEIRANAELKVVQANARAERIAEQAAIAAQEAADARLIAAAADEEYVAASKLSARALRQRAVGSNLPLPVQLGVPSTAGTYRAGEEGLTQAERAARSLNAERDLTDRARRVQGTLGAYWGTYGRNMERLGATGRVIDGAASRAIGATARGVSFVERTAGRLTQLGGSLRGFATALGPLDYALIGLTAYELLKDPIKNAASDLGEHYYNVQGIEQSARAQEAALIKQLQTQHRVAGTPIPQLTYDALSKNIDQDAQERRAGLISQREFDRRMANHAVEAKILLNPTKAQIEAARAALAAASRSQGGPGQYAEMLRGLSNKDLDTEQGAVGAQYAQDPARGLGHLRAVYQEYVRRYRNKNDAASIQALSNARQSYFQALSDRANSELQLANSQTGDPLAQARNSVRTATALARRARTVFGQHSLQYQQALQQLNQARSQEATAVEQHVEAENAMLLAQAGSDPVAQANAAVQAAQNTLRALLAEGRRANPDQVLQQRAAVLTAQTQRRDTVRQQNQQIADLYGQLAQANAGGNAVAAAQAAQRAARAALANATTRVERLQALVNLAQANNQLQQAVADQEGARFDYLESLTTDPVRQSELEVRKARAALTGTQGADRLRARAALNKAIQSERDARLSSREDDIEFERQMGQITVQDAIARYSNLLHIRNLTKQQRRDIELKIHQLQQEGDQEASGFNLDIGTFKLPTLFDVRKAFDPVRRESRRLRDAAFRTAVGAQAEISSNVSHMYDARSQVQANIKVIVNDKHAAGEVYDAIDRALGTTVRARMRSRGLRG